MDGKEGVLMDVMAACYKHWIDMILAGKKPFEFRVQPWVNAAIGSKLYLYETKRCGGAGMVMGEVTIEKIIPMEFKMSPHPYTFRYWLENIRKCPEAIAAMDKIGSFQMSHYKDGYVYNFMLCESFIDYILSHDELPPEFNTLEDRIKNPDHYAKMESARKLIFGYDDWMKEIGFWNDFGESSYKIAYQLKEPIRYEYPIPITAFLGANGQSLKRPPQSFQYIMN